MYLVAINHLEWNCHERNCLERYRFKRNLVERNELFSKEVIILPVRIWILLEKFKCSLSQTPLKLNGYILCANIKKMLQIKGTLWCLFNEWSYKPRQHVINMGKWKYQGWTLLLLITYFIVKLHPFFVSKAINTKY